MCGIIGVINASTSVSMSVASFMRQGLVASQLRGTDSTGYLQVGKKEGEVYLYKDTVNSSTFIEAAEAMSLLRDADVSPINVAHVRARTQGEVSTKNAHPFSVAKDDEHRLIGVHNGSLTNWKNQKDANKFDVDSHWAMHHIAKNGKDAFEDIHGPFAMVWWEEDKFSKAMIARNKDRPLHLMFNKAKDRVVFASEARMLAWIAERSGFDGDGDIREVPVGKLFTFDTAGAKLSWTVEELPSPKYKAAPVKSQSSYTIPVPTQYAILAEQLALVLEGKTPTVDATLRYGGYSRAADYDYSSRYANGWDLSDMDDYAPFSTQAETQSLIDLADFIIPEQLLPAQRHTGVDDTEVALALAEGVLGMYLIVDVDTYIPSCKSLFGVANYGGRDYDVVFRNIGKRQGQRLAGSGGIQDAVIVGIEADGTLIVSLTTKRIRDFLEN